MIENAYRDPDDGDRHQKPANAGRRWMQPKIFPPHGPAAWSLPQCEKQTIHVNLHPAAKSVTARRTVEADGSRHFCTRIFSRKIQPRRRQLCATAQRARWSSPAPAL
ncbi:hypothetical protein MESS4_230027 [Mesorhizobium sp. STM 4661]|nr:hypothetical protein MESS4_230027 [Mesorhizobium sp. STM 4661]